ncbi:MAG: hypothetical protein AB7L65_10195 [Hyphomonadaceae bacterium]
MRLFARRRLTAGEIALGRAIFGEEIDWARIRIAQAPPLWFAAMAPIGRTIWFGRWRAPADFAAAPLAAQGWLLHELAHAWQAAHGRVLALAKLGALGAGAYRIAWFPGARWEDFNIEAQAEIVRMLFLARAGAPTEIAHAELERLWATRLTSRARLPGSA